MFLSNHIKYCVRLQNALNPLKSKFALVTTFQHDFSTQAEVKLNKSNDTSSAINLENAKPYETIPGPSTFEFIRSAIPGGVNYRKSTGDMIMHYFHKYGPLFRMPAFLGNPTTLVSMNPEDYQIIFHNEGHWPHRRSFDTQTYYREVYRHDFFNGTEGILATNGEKWAKVRTAVNPVLMQPKNARLYLKTLSEVNDEFLKRIREIRDPTTHEMPDTFEDEINRLAFESVAAVALNTQLGLIRKNRDTAETKTIINSIRKVFDLAYELDIMPSLWKYVKTPKFREMMDTLDTLTNICKKYINEALRRIEHDHEGRLTSEVGKEKSVLEKLVRIDKTMAIVMALDMMMAGVDTTSSTLIGILLCIAKNPEKQAKLFDEIVRVMPQKDSHLTIENLQNLPYLRACIKEGIRLYPLMPGTMRALPVDVVLSGYHVPKGIDVVIAANLQLHDDKNVPRANEFIPERWIRNSAGNSECPHSKLAGEITNPFIYQPFGFGPRSCAGKRIVNLELEITISNLIRNFHIEFNYPTDNAFKAKFINVPAIPLKFKFEERQA